MSSSPKAWLSKYLGSIDFHDLLNAKQHSQDFSQTRSDYIARRLRFMLLVFAVAICLWIPVDLLTLSKAHFDQLVWARVALSASLIVLWLLSLLVKQPWQIYPILTASLGAILSFYVASMLIITSGEAETPQAGYKAIPFLMIALTGLFPLTIVMSLANIAWISAFFLALSLWQGQLTSIATLNELWVLALISGCSLWIQSGQLLMLLKLYRESTRDPLTGLVNRRVLMQQLDNQFRLAQESQHTFSILMLDLDRFKRINDNYGHATGDLVLKKAANTLTQHARPGDIVARYGGEEFMLIMPNLTSAQSRPLAEQILNAIAEQSIPIGNGETLTVTTSIGLTHHQPSETIEQTIERADTLLYQAKQQGRNQVISTPDQQQEE